jgi:glycosyltransferase involved in cell wall biosynthesis
MRVIHIVPAIAEEGSGPSYSVVRLCESLIEVGADVTLAAMNLSATRSSPPFVRLFPMGLGPRRAGRSPKMYRWLKNEVAGGSVDVLHSHGMWQMNAAYPGWAAQGHGAQLIVSPRGAFSRWAMAYGSRVKRLFWPLVQRPALAHASCFHTTAEAEYDDIRRLGFRQPVALLPNAVDVPPVPGKPTSGARTLLFLGRVHPVKGIDILLHAWSQVMERHPEWRLSIVGTDAAYGAQDRYLEMMKALTATLGLKRVQYGNPCYGEGKWAAYREADLFVLPTHSESFGMTVAESLAAGTPVIVTKGAPWKGLTTHQSGWWIDLGVEALVGALEQAMCQPRTDLAQLGANGRQWMIDEFSWHSVAAKMALTYQWLTRGGDIPAWVTTDRST